MISQLIGKVAEVVGLVVTLDVHGVGYEVHCSTACAERLVEGELIKIVVFTEVREDSIKLYGFIDRLERQVFNMLTQVKGIGARSAMELISKINKIELLKIIADQDLTRLLAVKGIGRKTAERIIVELKDKVAEFVLASQSSRMGIERLELDPASEAIEALKALGFSARQAELMMRQASDGGKVPAGAASSDFVREALRFT